MGRGKLMEIIRGKIGKGKSERQKLNAKVEGKLEKNWRE